MGAAVAKGVGAAVAMAMPMAIINVMAMAMETINERNVEDAYHVLDS